MAGKRATGPAGPGGGPSDGPEARIADTVIVLMGVSGAGKTTVAEALRDRLGWPFQEGDDLHPPANVEKMHAGHPLDDADRRPWLEAIAGWIDARLAAGEPGIITCSNLKRAYRRITIGDRRGVTLVYLEGDENLIAPRVGSRAHRYMPASLLHSQFETLEPPEPEEHPVVVQVSGSPEETAAEVLRSIAAEQARKRR